jgi:hypothetical protein
MSTAGRVSEFEKYILVIYGLYRASALVLHLSEFERLRTHSLEKTFSRRRGPIRLFVSNVAAVASAGIHSSDLVIMVAICFWATRASKPVRTPRHRGSLAARPSSRKRHGWKSNFVTTGPSISASPSSGSKRWTISCKSRGTSKSARLLGDGVEPPNIPVESAESERRTFTNSSGPTSLLVITRK